MPIKPIVEVDTLAVEKKLRKFAKKAGVTVQFVAWDQLRLWTADLMRKTAPKKFSDGRLTVDAGLAELFEPMDTAGAFAFWKDRLAKQGSDLIVRTKTGKMRITNKSLKASSVGQMKTLHKASRTKRGGVSMKNIQRRQKDLAFGGKLIVAKSNYNKYRKEKRAEVGYLKAGWLPALEFWSRKANSPAKIPKFVQRHADRRGYPSGTIDDSGNGFVAATNAVAYANRRISQDHLIELTKQGRQRDLSKGAFKRMDDLVKRFNSGRAI
jgi:hypothetical protein